ncbi:hypothetical protein BE21_48190 [Sorangium cellulosum]|uniref:Uncharacterized protein n=1 Tax=Sorangium cellulosum TaxID=56 RepID=A0A150THS7_SORCE|nr:hypothetical protein BE21_48190 [Sorangium cellulosum]
MKTHDGYVALLASGGKRKLRANSLLAYGDEESRFEAAVLFHEAAEIERRALSLLEDAAPETRLRAAVERCACLVMGFDVVEAARAFREVEEASAAVPQETANAHRDRLDPLYFAARQDLTELLKRAPVLVSSRFRWEGIAETDRSRARAELDALLQRFPGESTFHLVDARAALDERRFDALGRAVRRAHRLCPDNPLLRAYMLLVTAQSIAYPGSATTREEAEAELDTAYQELNREPADGLVYLGFMTASLAAFLAAFYAGEDAAEVHGKRARWAAEVAAQRRSIISEDIGKYIEAAGPLIELLTTQPQMLTAIIENTLREALLNSDVGRASGESLQQLKAASLIRGVISQASRWLTPSAELAELSELALAA